MMQDMMLRIQKHYTFMTGSYQIAETVLAIMDTTIHRTKVLIRL